MRVENYHMQGKLYELVYAYNTHAVTCLGAMTLFVVINAFSVCVVSQKALTSRNRRIRGHYTPR